jgi:hypothetical protein
MSSITFLDLCSLEYVEFITRQFHHMHAFPLSVNALMDLNVERQIAIILASDTIVHVLAIESIYTVRTLSTY